MSESAGAVAIDLDLVGATESPQRLHGNGFESIETDAAGARAITRGKNRILWDLSNGQRIEGDWVRLHPDGVRALRNDPDGVALCDVASGERRCLLEEAYPDVPPTLSAGELAFHPVRKEADESTKPMTPNVWSLATGKKLHALEPSLLAAVLPGDRAVLVSARGTATIWDLASGKLAATLKGVADKPIKLRVSPDGKRAVMVGKRGVINVWDAESGQLVGSSDTMGKEYGGGARDHFEIAADGRSALFASRPGSYGDHFVGVMDLASGALDLSWTTADEEREISAFVPFPASAHLAILIARSASTKRRIELWDVGRRALVAAKESRFARVLAVVPDVRVVVAGSAMASDSFLHVYRADPRPGEPLPQQPAPGAGRPPETAAEPPERTAEPPAEATPAKKKRKPPAR